MQFNKVNSKSMRLSDDAKVSKTYTRQVEEDSRLTQFIEKSSRMHTPKEALKELGERSRKRT